ncbi:PilW family protein [Wohlfahrtiimonas chitiniclastica]|uniref:PilW family protein n=1 Tax=Wohlfahrtiimonas chitiniclastica TaxID=400946 RepID=UPI00215833CB|nr:hypothetical protein [Wohlfahrtiimonas chitiniclastica]MDC7252922.1 hypothetical protein [Wohlfahrtiimonas chitiniclastica]
MLKIPHSKGLSIIELMVALALGILLLFSMLAFYAVTQQNVTTHRMANQEQQQLRKLFNLLSKDLENVGAFECAKNSDIFDDNRFPRNVIALGDYKNRDRKQFVFAHPITEAHVMDSLGIIEATGNQLNYSPIKVASSCGQDDSSLYVGATILEVIPPKDKHGIFITTQEFTSQYTDFVILSTYQTRVSKESDLVPTGWKTNNAHKTVVSPYPLSIHDAVSLLLMANEKEMRLPFKQNDVKIELGFSNHQESSSVPNIKMTSLTTGGWLDPYENETKYNLIVDKTGNHETAKKVNKQLHSEFAAPIKDMITYPLNKKATEQVRAIRFTFTLVNPKTNEKSTLERVIRFKNMHLNSLHKDA